MNKVLLFCFAIFLGIFTNAYADDELTMPSDDGIGYCYRPHDNTGTYEDNSWARDPMNTGPCTQSQYTDLGEGEWIARFVDIDITGISLCTNIFPSEKAEEDYVAGTIAENQDAINAAFYAWANHESDKNTRGKNCYCKSSSINSNWVFNASLTDYNSCEHYCTAGCARSMITDPEFFWAVR